MAAVFVGWAVARALSSAGRPVGAVGVLLAAAAAAAAGIASAVHVGSGPVAARDVPVLLLGRALLSPGVLAPVGASRT